MATSAGRVKTIPARGAAVAKNRATRSETVAVSKRHRARDVKDFKASVVTIRVQDQLKRDATKTLSEIGISLPEAVRVFLSRVVSDGGFPFRLEVPNAVTRAAMAESDRLNGAFSTPEELFDGLEKGRAR